MMRIFHSLLLCFALSAPLAALAACPGQSDPRDLELPESFRMSGQPLLVGAVQTVVLSQKQRLETSWGYWSAQSFCRYQSLSDGRRIPIRASTLMAISFYCKSEADEQVQNIPYTLNPGEYGIINESIQYYCPSNR